MSIILNIDTTSERAIVSLSENGKLLSLVQNSTFKEHASFLQPGIQELVSRHKISLSQIDAVAVVNGPGSYTGLRVGLASAKGICYIANKPLICIGTLPLMANAAASKYKNSADQPVYLCPMIDARRIEVFTAIYTLTLEEIIAPQALVLSDISFVDILLHNRVLFFGDGAKKWQAMTSNTNALFAGSLDTTEALAGLSHDMFVKGLFTDLAYSEPLYVKEFYNG